MARKFVCVLTFSDCHWLMLGSISHETVPIHLTQANAAALNPFINKPCQKEHENSKAYVLLKKGNL